MLYNPRPADFLPNRPISHNPTANPMLSVPMMPFDPEDYPRHLDEKVAQVQQLFVDLPHPDIQVMAGQPLHYRMRCEFRIWHEGEDMHYAMYQPGSRQPRFLEQFPLACEAINALMPALRQALMAEEVLRRKLYEVHFLTTLSGQMLVTLVYHKPLDDTWRQAAESLRQQLGIQLVGRARKQKLILGRPFVMESLRVHGRLYQFQQVENSFTQPNAEMNQRMLEWAKTATEDSEGDLLELYCGNGNFSLVLADNFRHCLATEISKASVQSAEFNVQHNGIDNLSIARCSAEDFAKLWLGGRHQEVPAARKMRLAKYQFSTLLVDPPRAGLDEQTLELASYFRQILYISCNPESLKANIQALGADYEISQMALFDQFAFTPHIEAGVLLTRRAAG